MASQAVDLKFNSGLAGARLTSSLIEETEMEPLSLLREDQILPGNKAHFQKLKEADVKVALSNAGAQPSLQITNQDSQAQDASERIHSIFTDSSNHEQTRQYLYLLGLSAFYAFLQANVTGPPFTLDEYEPVSKVQSSPLSVDGISVYPLISHVELLEFANQILNHKLLDELGALVIWSRLRLGFWHQKLLTESSTLREKIYGNIELLDKQVSDPLAYGPEVRTRYLLERAAINTFHGRDQEARDDIAQASKSQHFEYLLTGHLGKRTKFQQNDLSQLVVLAKSADDEATHAQALNGADGGLEADRGKAGPSKQPEALDLNDDTLLESIAFTKPDQDGVQADKDLPASLAALDPSDQPILKPLDSIILLALASSITNTSPEHGLTREETLPYVTRVLKGGSSNWQIYTQALLVRSRIEGYKSRTVERSVLQLQALVDQVIAAITGSTTQSNGDVNDDGPTTFLPSAQESESASAAERLCYIHQLSTPYRWSLEAELASKWVSLGALRTAVEIYERLQMWAEVALCWAATGEEGRAREIVRRQLGMTEHSDDDSERARKSKPLGADLPPDAPRLLCILGDIDSDPELYKRAWAVSENRYARAQRSLGKFYMSNRELEKADEAYAESLRIEPQNAGAWFSLGCVRLAREDWNGSVEAFTRVVQIEPEDAEAWSNLGAALLRLPTSEVTAKEVDAEDDEIPSVSDTQKHAKEALVTFKRAATLKRDKFKMWQNILNVAATITPPPYADVITAQKRLIELRGAAEGEACIDVEIMEGILAHVIASQALYEPSTSTIVKPAQRHGLSKVFTDLVIQDVKPLITSSRRLWQMVARLHLYLNQPGSALDAYEKAWRTTTNAPSWDDGMGSANEQNIESAWNAVVDSTIELVDAYESLGDRETSEGLGAGSGQLVCKNWRFKARMAIRSVLGRCEKAGLGGTGPLEERLQQLKSN